MGGVGQSLPTGKQVNLIKEFLPEETAGPPFSLSHWGSEWHWGKIRVFIVILEEKTHGNWTRWFLLIAQL